MRPCPVDVTIPEHDSVPFHSFECKTVYTNITHWKQRAQNYNDSRVVCETVTVTGENGEKYEGEKINCRNMTWEAVRLVWMAVPMLTKESECTQQPPINYQTCYNTTATSEQQCTDCVARALPKCETITRQECANVSVKSCRPATETSCNWHWNVPLQEYTDRKVCFDHNNQLKEEVQYQVFNLREADDDYDYYASSLPKQITL